MNPLWDMFAEERRGAQFAGPAGLRFFLWASIAPSVRWRNRTSLQVTEHSCALFQGILTPSREADATVLMERLRLGG